MLKSTAPVKIPVFALNKFSPSWEQDECEREQSYRPLLLGQGCAFGLMIGKRMVLGGGWGSLSRSNGWCSSGWEHMVFWRELSCCCRAEKSLPSAPGAGVPAVSSRRCWHLCKPRGRGPRVSHQNWDSWQSSFLCRLCEMHTIPQSLQAQLQTKQRWQEWHSLANYSVVPSVYLVLCHQLQPAFF